MLIRLPSLGLPVLWKDPVLVLMGIVLQIDKTPVFGIYSHCIKKRYIEKPKSQVTIDKQLQLG